MGIFTKEEKLVNKNGKVSFETTKKGLPKIRRDKTPMGLAVKNFQKAERSKRKAASKKKWAATSKRIDKARTSMGKRISPDLLSPGGGGLDLNLGMGSSKIARVKVKKQKKKYVVVNNKAYQIAGTGKKKKKKKKKSSGDSWGMDPFDFGGF